MTVYNNEVRCVKSASSENKVISLPLDNTYSRTAFFSQQLRVYFESIKSGRFKCIRVQRTHIDGTPDTEQVPMDPR
jgi:hypothetical protein